MWVPVVGAGSLLAAAVAIIYGSVKALSQGHLKKRLGYSTVSQVSYIAPGTAILGPLATIGGVVHLVHQGVIRSPCSLPPATLLLAGLGFGGK